jgi:hypothetical protein
MKYDARTKSEFFLSIKIEIFDGFGNAEPSIHSTFRGKVTDSRKGNENAFDWMRFNHEPFSSEINESDLHQEKCD